MNGIAKFCSNLKKLSMMFMSNEYKLYLMVVNI